MASLQATGFDLPDQDAFAVGRGMAVTATADNPSAIYYNPAGITQQKGHNARAGIYGLSMSTSYKSNTGLSSDTEDAFHLVPQLFYTYSPEKFPLSFGLGVFSPFGLSQEWPQTTGFRTVALEASLKYMTINPVVAWEVVPTLSIGGGATINYSETDLKQGITPIPYNDEFRFKGDDMDYGFNAGVLWKPHPKLSFGANYRSATTMNYDGYTETSFVVPPPGYPTYLKVDATARFPIPQKIVGGVSYRPTPEWNIEFNLDWTDWDRLNTVPINQAVPVPPLVLNWESSFYYELGVTRYLAKGWSVSAGYIYNENSIPDATYTPLVADMDRHFISLGVSYRIKQFVFDLGYQFGYGPTRTVSGSASTLANENADGEYDFISNAFALSGTWRF